MTSDQRIRPFEWMQSYGSSFQVNNVSNGPNVTVFNFLFRRNYLAERMTRNSTSIPMIVYVSFELISHVSSSVYHWKSLIYRQKNVLKQKKRDFYLRSVKIRWTTENFRPTVKFIRRWIWTGIDFFLLFFSFTTVELSNDVFPIVRPPVKRQQKLSNFSNFSNFSDPKRLENEKFYFKENNERKQTDVSRQISSVWWWIDEFFKLTFDN